ncbi:hypothetical protein CHS0354_025434 [Potamilus streckersoni]|uniref:Uncharacterized protein n=1 Tax=Potamilus streckersoni TaxID=2493646 RepID=A0AAE0SQ68_9BIVA|nr:hypothetical protein CHS0354_025434 [Potamilus streckersoni]
MIRHSDLMKVLFIYTCIFHVCPANPCGDNPIRKLVNFSKTSGRDPTEILSMLRTFDDGAFRGLERDFRRYTNCMKMVDTGYFKRSVPAYPNERLIVTNEHPARENRLSLMRLLKSRLTDKLPQLMDTVPFLVSDDDVYNY